MTRAIELTAAVALLLAIALLGPALLLCGMAVAWVVDSISELGGKNR